MILPFLNGSLDLNTLRFLSGVFDPYMIKNTGINYVAYDADHVVMQEIEKWLEQCQPQIGQRQYIKKMMSMFLTADIDHIKLFIAVGNGCNGKSIFSRLLKKVLGDFATYGDFQMSTVAVASAVDTHYLTIFDDVSGAYNESVFSNTKSKMLVTCTVIPRIPQDLRSQVVILDWPVTFVRPRPDLSSFEQPRNYSLRNRIDDWAPYLAGMMVMWRKCYHTEEFASVSNIDHVGR